MVNLIQEMFCALELATRIQEDMRDNLRGTTCSLAVARSKVLARLDESGDSGSSVLQTHCFL